MLRQTANVFTANLAGAFGVYILAQ